MSAKTSAFMPSPRQWFVAVAAGIVLLALGLYQLQTRLFDQARETAEDTLRSVATLQSSETRRWLDDRLMFLGQPPGGVMAAQFARLLGGVDAAPARRALEARFRHLHATLPELESVWLYDAAGRPRLGTAGTQPHLDERHAAAAHEALAQRRGRLVDLHVAADAPGRLALEVLVPLIADAAEGAPAIGYALFHIDPGMHLFPTIQSWPVASATAESVLLRREGDEAVYLSPLRHMAVPPMSLRRSLAEPGIIAGRALRGEGETLAGVDYRGEPVRGVALAIPGTAWLLVAKMDESEIFREANRTFAWVVFGSLIFFAALLALGGIYLVALRARANEARYRMLAESGSDVVWLYDLATRAFVYVSPSVERLRGYPVAEVLQETMADVLTPASYQMVAEELPRRVAAFAAGDEAERTRYYEVEQTRKDGSTVETEVVTTLIADAQGRATHIQGVTRDISARKGAEAQLRKLSLAVEQSPVSIVITNLDAEIEYVNDAFVEVTGYSRAEALGKNPRLLQSGKTPRATYEALWQALTNGETWQGEFVNRRKNGSEYVELARISPICEAGGCVTQYLAVKENITERRRLETTLQESEEKFRTIYDSINDAIFVYDATSGRVLDVNAAACRMYGYSREQLLNLDVACISAGVAPYTPEAAREYIRRARETGHQAFEWRARDAGDGQFWVGVTLQTVRVGGETRVMAVVRDIDESKRAEAHLMQVLAETQALNRKLAEAQSQLLQSEKMASIGQLAAGVAHELNNPIGFVSSNLSTLDRYLKDIFAVTAAYEAVEQGACADCTHLDSARALKRDKDFDFLKTDIVQLMAESKDGLGRVSKIVRDLKDFSRAGDASMQWADLHQGIDSTLNIVWNELKYKCTVKKDYGELPPVWCVPSQLNQVFMNLLVNAAHAIPDKGEIAISTGRRGEEVFVAIADTGSGIAAEHLNRIFEPFFTTKPVGKGTGLGLSLAYSIVQKHKGRIEVASEPGRGTAFTVWLPIGPASAEETKE